LARRITEDQKEEIIQSFKRGKTVDFLSQKFNFNKLTIIRNLKKSLGLTKYEELNLLNKTINKDINLKKDSKIDLRRENSNESFSEDNLVKIETNNEFAIDPSFIEIAPLDYEIDNAIQKDLSSIPISEINFPKTVYMIVDKKIELEIKFLKDYPEWQFLSEDELVRKTIEIHYDLKIAKSLCNKEQKVIKVPNTNVFKLVAPFLLSKGISRIVTKNNLIAL
tara:strand:+ start:40 stop:705 length:666 start_codon:yes stop_codon:yes gene_type:complete